MQEERTKQIEDVLHHCMILLRVLSFQFLEDHDVNFVDVLNTAALEISWLVLVGGVVDDSAKDLRIHAVSVSRGRNNTYVNSHRHRKAQPLIERLQDCRQRYGQTLLPRVPRGSSNP
jgi:hypothetical protein